MSIYLPANDYSTCVVSILRLQSLYVISKAKDVTWENPLAAIWSSVEINTGILCSCLPTLRSYVSRLFPRLFGTQRSTPAYDAKDNSDSSGATPQSCSRNSKKSRMPFDTLGRGLTGLSEPTQSSYVHARGDGGSADNIEFADLRSSPEMDNGQIQVTTVVEQDIEKIGGAHSDTGSTHELVRPMRDQMMDALRYGRPSDRGFTM